MFAGLCAEAVPHQCTTFYSSKLGKRVWIMGSRTVCGDLRWIEGKQNCTTVCLEF